MVRTLKWLAAALGVLVLLALAVYLASRNMAVPDAEHDAVALIDAPLVYEGRNGFAELYTMAHDVPENERVPLVAEDVRRMAASPLQTVDGLGAPAWRSALEDWPKLGESRTDDPEWCSLREPGCLARVRVGMEGYAGLLERDAAPLDRAAALSAWDYFANPFPPRLDMPFPPYQSLTRLTTRDAWRFANGEIDAGLAGACTGVTQGRKMIEAGDSLIGSMIGAALVRGNASLFADMLAELPRDHALPPQCEAAFTLPISLENGICRTMLSEARFVVGGIRTQITAEVVNDLADNKMPAWISRLLFDPERTVARMAPKFAWFCGEQAHALLAHDRPLVDRTPPPTRWSMQCASNAVGCILADIAQPAYMDYGIRLQDADAQVRTTAAMLWLRAQEGAMDETMLARLPLAMRSLARPLRIDAAASILSTSLYEKPRQGESARDGVWSVPLPASRLRSADASP